MSPARLLIAISASVCFALAAEYQTLALEKGSLEKTSYVKGGSLFLKDGKKYMDETGDIVRSYDVGGKTFYILKKQGENADFILREYGGKYTKSFGASAIRYYDQGYVATKSSTNTTNFYDNIWKITANGAELVGKNLPLVGFTNGIYDVNAVVFPSFDGSPSSMKGYHILDVTTGSVVHSDIENYDIKRGVTASFIKPSDVEIKGIVTANIKKPFLLKPKYRIIGASGANLILFYEDENGDWSIAYSNPKAKVGKIVINEKQYPGALQFIKKNGKEYLRLFNEKVYPEKIFNEANIITVSDTKTGNKASRYIDLETMKEVEIQDVSDFEVVVMDVKNKTFSGGVNKFVTYLIEDIKDVGSIERGILKF